MVKITGLNVVDVTLVQANFEFTRGQHAASSSQQPEQFDETHHVSEIKDLIDAKSVEEVDVWWRKPSNLALLPLCERYMVTQLNNYFSTPDSITFNLAQNVLYKIIWPRLLAHHTNGDELPQLCRRAFTENDIRQGRVLDLPIVKLLASKGVCSNSTLLIQSDDIPLQRLDWMNAERKIYGMHMTYHYTWTPWKRREICSEIVLEPTVDDTVHQIAALIVEPTPERLKHTQKYLMRLMAFVRWDAQKQKPVQAPLFRLTVSKSLETARTMAEAYKFLVSPPFFHNVNDREEKIADMVSRDFFSYTKIGCEGNKKTYNSGF